MKENSNQNYKHVDTITGLFVASLLITNLLSSAKIVDLGISLGPIPLVFDGGLIIFPLCYIFGDILTEVYGFRQSRKIIWLGFIASALMSILIRIIQALPGETGWAEAGGQAHYEAVLFGLSSGGLIIASLTAYLVGEFLNAMVLSKMKVLSKGKFIKSRFFVSTLVGQIFDTLVFVTIACIFGVFPFSIWLSLILTKYIIKVLIEAAMLPVTVRVSNYLKKIENSDSFDDNVSLNPFKMANN